MTMPLTPDERKLLEELTAKANSPDAEDFEIEIFSGDKGARIPFSQGAKWLHETFGIGDAPAAPAGQQQDGQQQQGGQAPKPGVRSLFRTGGQAGQQQQGGQQGQRGA
jgi:hypothetical protein